MKNITLIKPVVLRSALNDLKSPKGKSQWIF